METAIFAALKAGEEITKIYEDPRSDFEIERKADNSPLTVADRRSNAVIMERLKNTPYPVISEENRIVDWTIRKQWSALWIVDPLDGTKEFIKRNGEFTVNIALVCGDVPVLGVIYIPVKKTLYFGTLHSGAFRADLAGCNAVTDEQQIEARALSLPIKRKDDRYTVVASRSHQNPETADFIARLRTEHPDLQLVSIGSSIKICLVAEGSADLYPRFAPTMEWDTAAGHAIVLATGKNLYRRDGTTPLTYNKENLQNPWFIAK